MNKFLITESQLKLIKEAIEVDEIKLPDFILNSVKEYKTSLGNHPAFPPDDETRFEEKILKKRYYELLTNVKKVDGTKGDVTKKNLINILKELTIKCKEIEDPIKKELEEICYHFVIDKFHIKPGDINIECVITDDIKIKSPMTPKAMIEDFDDIGHIESINKEILKRRFINALIQGASTRLSSDYTPILNKLYQLDHRLSGLYHDIIAVNEFLSFVKEQKPNNDNIGGEVSVDLVSENTVIKSEGIIFPVLVFETIKGIMELLSSHALPQSKSEAEYVISKADFKLAENWDKRLGVGMWDVLQDAVGKEYVGATEFVELISVPVDQFNTNMREIFGKTKKGKQIVNDIINGINRDVKFSEIESSIPEQSNDEFFTPEELISSIVTETDTTSAGDYTYDVPMFTDAETADHKNMITRSIQDGLTKSKKF